MRSYTIQAANIPVRRRQSSSEDANPDLPYQHLKQLQVVFKVSERCNLACDYCYFFFASDDSWKQHPPVAPVSTLEAAARFASSIAVRYGLKSITFVFHGGEPFTGT